MDGEEKAFRHIAFYGVYISGGGGKKKVMGSLK